MTTAHRERFAAALAAYRAACGQAPPGQWRALLYILTARPDLWERAEPHLHYAAGRADLMGESPWQDLEPESQRLLAVARTLCHGGETEPLAQTLARLAEGLSPEGLEVLIEALWQYWAGDWAEKAWQEE